MGNPSTAAKNRYNRKAYDRVNITFPKGRKKSLQTLPNHKEWAWINI